MWGGWVGGLQGFLSVIFLFLVIFGHFFVLAVVAVTAATAGCKPRCHPGRRRAGRGELGLGRDPIPIQRDCLWYAQSESVSEFGPSASHGRHFPSHRLPRMMAADNFYSLVVELEIFAAVHWTETFIAAGGTSGGAWPLGGPGGGI